MMWECWINIYENNRRGIPHESRWRADLASGHNSGIGAAPVRYRVHVILRDGYFLERGAAARSAAFTRA